MVSIMNCLLKFENACVKPLYIYNSSNADLSLIGRICRELPRPQSVPQQLEPRPPTAGGCCRQGGAAVEIGCVRYLPFTNHPVRR